MRIALIVPGGVDRSGEVRVIPALLALIERLARLHDLHVLALYQEDAPASWPLLGATVHNIGPRGTHVRAVRQLLQLNRAARLELVHSIWSGPCGLVAVAAAKLLRIPSVIHIAGGELASVPEIGYGGSLHWRGRMREALVLRAATLVTSASDPMIETLSQLGIPSHRVPLGVDLKRWPPRAPVERDPHASVRLIQVASINRVKDPGTLIRALALLAARGVAFEMTLVGEDTLNGEVQALTRELGISDRVIFAGFLPQQALHPLVARADLMMMASRHETGPVAVLEAAALGVPTVGTAVGHLAEWAPMAAIAVPVGDPIALADAAHALLTDEPRRLALARAAHARALAEDADFTAQEVLDLYSRALLQRRAHRR